MRSAVSSRTQSSPASSSRRRAPPRRRWMRALTSSARAPSSSRPRHADQRRQREPLDSSVPRITEKVRKMIRSRSGNGAAGVDRQRQGQRGGERDGAAHARSSRRWSGTARAGRARARARGARASAAGRWTGRPREPDHDHGAAAISSAVEEQRAVERRRARRGSVGSCRPTSTKSGGVEQEGDDLPDGVALDPGGRAWSARACSGPCRCRP